MDFNPSVRNQDVIVMDCGSAYLRIGFDSEHLPRLVKLTRAGGTLYPGVPLLAGVRFWLVCTVHS